MGQSVEKFLQELGPAAFRLWVHLIKEAKGGEDGTIVASIPELATSSGVVSQEGGSGLGPINAALRTLVSKKFISATPEPGRRCRISLLKMVDIE